MDILFKDISRETIDDRYKKYGLTKNPFPLGGNFPKGYLQYTYLTENEILKIRNFLISTFEREEFNGMIVLGDYGSGKSHILNVIHESVNADVRGIFRGQAKSFLIQNPNVAPADILHSMFQEINLGTIQDLIFLPVRQKLHIQYGDDALAFLDQFTDHNRNMQLGEKWQPDWYKNLFSMGYREFRQELQEHNITLKLKEIQHITREILKNDVINNDIIAEGLLGLLFKDEAKGVDSWESFLASSFGGKKGRVVGTDVYLEAFLKLFQKMGIRHVYLLVDEIEDLRTSRLSKNAAVEYLATLRRMIQHNYKMFSFVLASTPDAWDALKLYYPAIEDRFPVPIDLTGSLERTKDIIAEYLQATRTADYSANERWHPFSEAAVDKLIELRGNVLRNVLTECRNLIDYCCQREDISLPFSPEFIEEQTAFNLPLE